MGCIPMPDVTTGAATVAIAAKDEGVLPIIEFVGKPTDGDDPFDDGATDIGVE